MSDDQKAPKLTEASINWETDSLSLKFLSKEEYEVLEQKRRSDKSTFWFDEIYGAVDDICSTPDKYE